MSPLDVTQASAGGCVQAAFSSVETKSGRSSKGTVFLRGASCRTPEVFKWKQKEHLLGEERVSHLSWECELSLISSKDTAEDSRILK